MSKMNYEELVDLHIPNFRRIQQISDTENNINDILMDLAYMIKKVYDVGLLESLGKYINLELGICILKDKEIDKEKIQELVKSFKK